MSNPGIYVCGTPRGGTSCVAGILHHLGLDMGEFDAVGPDGYCKYEDRRARDFIRPMGRYPFDATIKMITGPNGARDFRAYLAMRETEANGKPWGCKLGVNYPLSGPHPETLPVRWVFVDRPLEVSIRSDAAKTKPADPVKRAMQIAGYWAGKEWLKTQVESSLELCFQDPWIRSLHEDCSPDDIEHVFQVLQDKVFGGFDDKQLEAASAFVDGAMVSTWDRDKYKWE